MELTVGAILEGKVKTITNFGAFILLPENKTGMVHISEIANTYVSDIHQHLTEGQDVKVMVIGLDNGRVNLSIKRLEPRPQRDHENRNNFHGNSGRREGNFHRDGGNEGHSHFEGGQRREGSSHYEGGQRKEGGFHREGGYHRDGQNRNARGPVQPAAPKTADQIFEEKLKQFMTESDSKISSIKQYSDHRTKNRRR